MKRTILLLFATGLAVFCLALIQPDFLPAGGAVRAETESRITLDVALDCRKFNYMRSLALTEIVRGDSFILDGKIFPAGALRAGQQVNDPNAPGSIGSWVSTGTSTDTLAGHLANPTSPAVFGNQYFLLNNGMLVTAGWFAPAGTSDISVTGGTRAYSGASGEVLAENIGTNATGCPNSRFTIVLKKQAPK
jgi:hypothetical protein